MSLSVLRFTGMDRLLTQTVQRIIKYQAAQVSTLLYLKWIPTRTYCIAHGTLLNVICQYRWKGGFKGIDTCIGMAESLRCSPETITTLLISYTPIQNVLVLKNNKNENLKKIILSSI